MTAAQIALFVPASFLVGLSPGPSNFLVFTNASRAGWARAVAALPGRMAAFALMIGAVTLGLDAVLRTSEAAFAALKWAGVAYLAYLGVRAWRAPVDALAPATRALARRELLTALGNPKAYLMFTAFLPQFVAAGSPMAPQLLTLGAIHIALEMVAASLWAAAGAWLGARALTEARRRLLNRATGGVLVGAAALLALAEPEAPVSRL